MPNVVVLAGGVWQYYITSFLVSKGHQVYVVNPVATDTTRLAHHIALDVKDVDGIVDAIRPLSPLFVCSDQSDVTPMPLARVCQRLNLAGNAPEIIEKYTNKHCMSKYAGSVGVAMPATRVIHSVLDVQDFAKEYGLPVVVKPVDSNSSKGFTKLIDLSQAQEAWDNALLHSHEAIVQEYISGKQVTLDGFCSGGKHRTFAAANIGFGFRNDSVISSVRYPCREPVLSKLVAMNDRYVENSGLSFGITHAEYRYNENGEYLLEIAARGGGSGTSSVLVPWATGCSLYELLYRCLLGDVVDLSKLMLQQRLAWLEYFAFPPGRSHGELEKTQNKVKTVPCVADFKFNFKLHEPLPVVTTGQQRHALVMLLGDDSADLNVALRRVISILNEDGWYDAA